MTFIVITQVWDRSWCLWTKKHLKLRCFFLQFLVTLRLFKNMSKNSFAEINLVSLRTSNCQYTLFKFWNPCRKSSKVASSPPPGTESVWPQFPGNDSKAGSPAWPQDFRLLRPTLTVLRPAADTLRELPAPPWTWHCRGRGGEGWGRQKQVVGGMDLQQLGVTWESAAGLQLGCDGTARLRWAWSGCDAHGRPAWAGHQPPNNHLSSLLLLHLLLLLLLLLLLCHRRSTQLSAR